MCRDVDHPVRMATYARSSAGIRAARRGQRHARGRAMIGRTLDGGAPLLPAALPPATPDEIGGLLRLVARLSHSGRVGVAELADAIRYDEQWLLSLLELLQVLGFAELAGGAVKLRLAGRRYARARDRERKVIFGEQLMRRLPLVAHFMQRLEERPGEPPTLGEILADLRLARPAEDLAAALQQVIVWCRYAGLFDFEETTGRLSLRRVDEARH
jgi:NitT/TauT family transport system ATP-binding protein